MRSKTLITVPHILTMKICSTSTVVILGPEIEDPALSQVNDSHVDSGKKFMIWLKKK